MFQHDQRCWIALPHYLGQAGYKNEVPPVPGTPLGPIASGWGPPDSMKTGRRVVPTLLDQPAVYRVEIGRPGALSAWYVGETQSLKSRMGQYGVMIRRLLAMYADVGTVIIDKDLFRVVHYEFARSLVRGDHLHWRWRYLADWENSKSEEEHEIAVSKQLFPRVRTLNRKHSGTSYGYFDTMPVGSVDPAWRDVHSRLQPHLQRKKLRIRRSVA